MLPFPRSSQLEISVILEILNERLENVSPIVQLVGKPVNRNDFFKRRKAMYLQYLVICFNS